ncbi:MAG: YggS family pyridoxal phosphate-dependent enzyme [Lentimicrobiaceae bacterium]|jgi:hypothetical protein
MNTISKFKEIRSQLPETVKIVAVSKTKPAAIIEELYTKTGHRSFGENKIQELEAKSKMLPQDIDWHFIGHLQTNKIKYIAPYIGMIQSVDSFRLLIEINKEAKKCNRVIPCLMQFYIASEETKYGFTMDEANRMLDDNLFLQLSNVVIKGVMGMATFTENNHIIRKEFETLYTSYNSLKSRYFMHQPDFCEISMGMTNDYQIAVEEGSTIVRIGSGIFGER